MDDKKDIQRNTILSKFLSDSGIRISPFGANVSGERAYQRAERLVVALHLLTNHISDTEPVRIHVRGRAIDLLSQVLELRHEMRSPESKALQRVLASIREVISMVRILAVSGSISLQNADVVVDALDELGNFILASQRSSLSESTHLTKDELLGSVNPSELSKIKDKVVIKDRLRTSNTSSNLGVIRARGQGILNVLKPGMALGIKDISAYMPEYSEKMVQRELASLIKGGKVKKIGFKRWSRYSLA